jgi:hypothetical protein
MYSQDKPYLLLSLDFPLYVLERRNSDVVALGKEDRMLFVLRLSSIQNLSVSGGNNGEIGTIA